MTNKTYTGSAIAQTGITVKLNKQTLSAKTDYALTYLSNKSAGTAYVVVTGKGAYSGVAVKSFTIAKASALKFSIANVTAQKYKSGKAAAPKLTVRFAGKALKAGADYTVAYKNNKKPGTATATVTGKGNFTGTKSVKFTIK